MDLVTCHCRNTCCAQCGKMGNASALQPHGSDRGEVRLRCMACGDVVSARTGTAYAGIRTDVTQYALGAKLLAEGLGVRATARILEVDKDTVHQWLRSLGTHGAEIMAYHFRHLHLTECQLDELWTFVKKKEGHLTPLLCPTAKNGMKLSDQISPFSFKMDSPHRLQSQFLHR